MSRIGKMPVVVPAGVEIKINGQELTVKGKNGTLVQTMPNDISFTHEGDEIIVKRHDDAPAHRSLHGLTRSLISNMVVGVTEGFTKELEIQGVGYRVAKQGKVLSMSLGFSHPIEIEEVDGITIDAPTTTKIIVSGADKQLVGHYAALIRSKRPPEPYKGKGIRYVGEYVIRKEGKAGKA